MWKGSSSQITQEVGFSGIPTGLNIQLKWFEYENHTSQFFKVEGFQSLVNYAVEMKKFMLCTTLEGFS